MDSRIEEIKKEVALLFAKNGIEGGLIHKTYIDYMNGNREEGYKPYIDSRVRFKGIRQLDKLMKEFKEINRG